MPTPPSPGTTIAPVWQSMLVVPESATMLPPIHNFPSTPAPPATRSAPVVVLVAAVVLATINSPPLIVSQIKSGSFKLIVPDAGAVLTLLNAPQYPCW